MIDEQRTLEIYGYLSNNLSLHSNKKIVIICEKCGKYKIISKQNYNKAKYSNLCKSCSCSGKNNYNYNKSMSEKTKIKIRKNMPDQSGKNNSFYGKYHTEETKQKMQNNSQHINGENHYNWKGGLSFGKYCTKFNNSLKQSIRDRYNNCDYISGLHKDICNQKRSLDVHHVDYDKDQGCGKDFNLIPLSKSNHVKTNTNRYFWNKLFIYSLEIDKIYYGDKTINMKEMI